MIVPILNFIQIRCSCFVNQEATQLSSLKADLDACGVGLYAVVHETFDVPGYQPFFAGEVYYDSEVSQAHRLCFLH